MSLLPISLDNEIFDDICNKIYESYKDTEVCICTIDEIKTNFNYKKLSHTIDTFHGTHNNNINSIIMDGFKSVYNITSAYGKGTYTAKDAKYSFNYMKNNIKSDLHYMFLCEITYDKIGLSGQDVDTYVNSITNPSIYVTKNDDQIKPKYLISFNKFAN